MSHSQPIKKSLTPLEAIQTLKDGNARFVNNLSADHDLLQQVNETRDGQWPFAVILSCIDSRTSAELIFDQGLGDVFSIRIAGNVINDDILGSMEYACKVAGSKLIVVMGHSKCGAIKGACDYVEMGNLTALLSKIQPAVYREQTVIDRYDRTSENPIFVQKVADINVRRNVPTVIERSYVLEHLVESKSIAIIGAMHDIETGVVTFLEDTLIDDLPKFVASRKI